MQHLKNKCILVLLILCTACSTRPRPASGPLPPDIKLPEVSKDEAPVFQEKRHPKLGIVLGPGGARTQAYVGFLRELERAQIPIHAIAGIE